MYIAINSKTKFLFFVFHSIREKKERAKQQEETLSLSFSLFPDIIYVSSSRLNKQIIYVVDRFV